MSTAIERPAPGRLEILREFVNTLDVETGADTLSDPERLRAWLVAQHLQDDGDAATAAQLDEARRLREAMRALMGANASGEDAPEAARALINQVTLAAALSPRLEPGGRSRLAVGAGGVAGALGRLLAILHEEIASGRFERLKACCESTCRWAFYDTSRNRSSHWCRMGTCGNRNKARAFRARTRAGAAVATDTPHPPH